MSGQIQSIRGMHDVLPPRSEVFSKIERELQTVLEQ